MAAGLHLSGPSESLRAQMGEAGSGDLVIYVAWKRFDASGVFLGYASDNATTIGNTTQTIFLPVDGTCAVKEVTSISMYNSDASNARTVSIYVWRTPGSGTRRFRATIPIGGTFEYAPGVGWRVYDVDGRVLGPTTP